MNREVRKVKYQKVSKKKKYRSNALGGRLVLIVLIVFMLVMAHQSYKLRGENITYAKEEAELKQQLKEEKQRKKDIEDYEAYTKTRKFVEEMAKDKLGLLYKDEILYKSND
jgi:cell division protein DivIC